MIWTREIAGWILLFMGMAAFGLTYFVLLLNGKIVESGPAAFMGFILLSSGVHLLKVALAARVCIADLNTPTTPRRELPRRK
jgi:hypothetical protein